MTTDAATPSEATVWRLRLGASCLVLLGLALVQSPGLLVADTKIDLTLAPLDFLGRAAHLWDAEGAFGQLQNQAYGYLWPMGPFFVLGGLLDVPGWVVQRLWLAVVLVVAFVGAARVSRALGVRSDLACIVAGFAYALSPRMLTTLGPISIEAWPSAMAPWVLLPLVLGATRGSPWRAAALSGLAVAFVGGVNAAATAAVLPLGALWLLTRTRGPRRWRMMVGWPVFTALGTLWWLVPLFVMGAYSPPFLDYIESAANTTFPTDLVDALRGTSNWVPYVDSSSRAGNDLVTQPYLVLNSAVVLGAGLLGLLVRRNRERAFLLLGVLAGLLLVTMGHVGSTEGWSAAPLRDLLDGALAPLRNVHKFDPVLRLPLVVGLAWSLAELQRFLVSRDRSERVNARLLAGVLVVAVAGASAPAALGRITPSGGFQAVPDYWSEAAGWLGEHQGQGVALLLPGSSFGSYTWGRVQDEPMQALAERPWAVRNAVPLTPPGNIRMLDGIEDRLESGAGSEGFTASLRRAGVTHLVVRNDLARSEDVVDPVLVHQAIGTSPGLERVATFGPLVGGDAHLDNDGQRVLVNGGWQGRYPAIEVFEVDGGPGYAAGSDSAAVVAGAPEDLDDLVDLGVLGSQPTVLAPDASRGGVAAGDGDWILTDGNRAVERHFGALHDTASQTLARHQPLRLDAAVRDYLLDDPERWSTFAEYDGIEGVRASGSLSDASAAGDAQPGRMPFAALDGEVETRWESRPTGSPPWWRVDLESPRTVSEVSLTAGPEEQRVTVRVAGWTSDPVRLLPGQTREVAVPDRRTGWLRVDEASGAAGASLSLSEVGIPGVEPHRYLRLPDPPEGASTPGAVVLRAVDEARTGCATVDGDVRCLPDRDVAGEEPLGFDRAFRLPAATAVPVRMRVRARPGPLLGEELQTGGLLAAGASSTANPDARASGLAAVDGDPGTTWTADADDEEPRLSVRWVGRRTVRDIRVRVDDDTAAARPVTVRLEWDGGSRLVELDGTGRGTFRPIRTTSVTVEVVAAEETYSLDDAGAGFTVPVGISELRLGGVPFLPQPPSGQVRGWGCGSGPDLVVNGERFRSAVRASSSAVYSGAAVPARLCGDTRRVSLRAGDNRVTTVPSAVVTPVSVVLGEPLAGASTSLTGAWEGPVRRHVDTGGQPLVSTRENANPGWWAPGTEALVVDGWRQGWTTGGQERVQATFLPDRTYRTGLLAGALGVVVLLGVVLLHLLRRRAGPGEVLRPARLRPAVAGVVAIGGAGLLVGTTGAVVAAVGVAVGALLRRFPPVVLALPVVLVVVATGSMVVRPWADPAGWAGDLAWPGYLLVAALALALAAASSRPRRAHRGGVDRWRIAGISTSR